MSCKRMERDGMRYLDREMSARERKEFEEHLENCPACRESLREFSRLEALTRKVKIKDPVDMFWEGYWKSIYRRVERKSAWILFISGLILVSAYAVFRVVRDFGAFTFEKAALLILLAGVLLLLISVVRERIHQKKVDKYKDIER
ncbi:MAG: zf-HC2 domain-containing protein [Candidatus Krumholzibacteriota bacterium]|nr:zf-HC2 domain-containing protein [Candidatus Krumholzibacteriota bacterium]